MKGILNSLFGNNVNGNNVMISNDVIPPTGDTLPTSEDTPNGDTVKKVSPDVRKRNATKVARTYYKGSAFSPFTLSDITDDGKTAKENLKKWRTTVTGINGVCRLFYDFTHCHDDFHDGLKRAVKITRCWGEIKSSPNKDEFKKRLLAFLISRLHPSLVRVTEDGKTVQISYVPETFVIKDGDTVTKYDVFTTTPDGNEILSYVPRDIERWDVFKLATLIIDDDERHKKTGDTPILTDTVRYWYDTNGVRHDITNDDTNDTPTGDTLPTSEDTPNDDTNDTPTGDGVTTTEDTPTEDTDDTDTDTPTGDTL